MSTVRKIYRRRRPASRDRATLQGGQRESLFFGEQESAPFFQPAVQRKCAACEGEEKVQRVPENKEDEKVQKKEAAHTSAAPTHAAAQYIGSINGKGQPLSTGQQSFYGNKMGADFSNVRIHTGAEAAASAKDINAKAYTYGNHIVFGEGQYRPGQRDGKHLLAHELAHVIQQGGHSPSQAHPKLFRSISVQSPYTVTDDYEPSAQYHKRSPALGRTDPLLNGHLQLPTLGPKKLEEAMAKPGFSMRDKDAIARPDLSDKSLDLVRANLEELRKYSTHYRAVKLVQEALIAWGRGLDNPIEVLPKYGADGDFKNETKAGVELFQAHHPGLTVDGVVGDFTLGELQKEMDKLHGKVFKLETVGHNAFTGIIHTPPPASQWLSLSTTPKEFDQNPAVMQAHRDMVAIHLMKNCANVNQLQVLYKAKGNVPAAVLTHEKVHEGDQVKTINKHMDPWDVQLQIALLLGFKTEAVDEQEAAEKLYKVMGIPNPEKLSKKVMDEWIKGNLKFHQTPEGSGVNTALDTPNCQQVIFTFSP